MSEKTTNGVLLNLKSTLEMAEYGLRDLQSDDPKYTEVGLRNLAMHGRSVTFVLQNLRSLEPNFEEWYRGVQEEIKSSELCSFFKDLRNEIEKQGKVRPTNISATINYFSTDMIERFPRPKNAVGFFLGDQLGGSGWEVELPDGSRDKIYLDLPKDIIETKRLFIDPPKDHLGKSLEGKTIQELGEIYYNYLSQLVDQAVARFKK